MNGQPVTRFDLARSIAAHQTKLVKLSAVERIYARSCEQSGRVRRRYSGPNEQSDGF